MVSTTLPQSVDVMARTIWGEARGCGVSGMTAVACAILNRIHHPTWWGHDVISVCQAPWQFSCWNAGDPNRVKIEAVTEDDPWFAIAVGIADRAVSAKLKDITNGADSYALTMRQPPVWAERGRETYRDTWHAFFAIERPLPGSATPAVPHGDPNAHPVSAWSQTPTPAETGLTAEDLNTLELARVIAPPPASAV